MPDPPPIFIFVPDRPLRVPDPGTEHGRRLVRAFQAEIDPSLKPSVRDRLIVEEMKRVK